jgi:hypothetical protein
MEVNYSLYEPITEDAALDFYDRVLFEAKEYFGVAPLYPIKTVHLVYSHRPQTDEPIPTAFQRCDLNDRESGEYTIYISSDEDNEEAFYGQFAHEIAHLLNPSLYDAYVVGFFTLFAQKMCNKFGKQWDDVWLPYFEQLMESISSDAFYAQTFFMASEIDKVIIDEERHYFLKSIVSDDDSGYVMHIDPNMWLAKMRPEIRPLILSTIQKYAQGIVDCRSCSEGNKCTFYIPEKDVEVDHSIPELYEPIQVDELDTFVRDGVALMKDFFGCKRQISSISLLNGQRPIGEQQVATESYVSVTDQNAGKYSITLNRDPKEKAFIGQLAFHLAELAMVELVDVFFQGYCSVFARKLCTRFGYDWDGVWLAYYTKLLRERSGDALFACSFAMMKEVDELLTEQDRQNFLKCVDSGLPKINVDKWASLMTKEVGQQTLAIITKQADSLSKCDTCSQM